MATAAERRRRRKNKSKKTKPAGASTTVHDLTDHIFERVLHFLGPSPCLVRAAATCRRWCRLVADAGFLTRLRSAHPHGTRLGEYHCDGYDDCFSGRQLKPTVFVPSMAAAAMGCGRFALDFLPGREGSWELVDSRGGLLLLLKLARRGQSCHFNFVVCEPLTRRYQVFLWPTALGMCFLGAFLVDTGGDAGHPIGMSNFKVLAVANEYLASVFSSGADGGWRLLCAGPVGAVPLFEYNIIVGRANGSVYWGINGRAAVLALDEATMEFSVVELPGHAWGLYNEEGCASRVIGGEDGALRTVRLINNELNVFVRQQHLASDGKDDEWVLEKRLGLLDATVGLPGREESFFEQGTTIVTANAEYVVVKPIPTRLDETWMFSVELDTMRVECEHERNKYNGEAYPYDLPWTPVLPNITSGRKRQ